jgi:hypothetical protein
MAGRDWQVWRARTDNGQREAVVQLSRYAHQPRFNLNS